MLCTITDQVLQDMGMKALGDRRMVLLKVSNFISLTILPSFQTCLRLIFIVLLQIKEVYSNAMDLNLSTSVSKSFPECLFVETMLNFVVTVSKVFSTYQLNLRTIDVFLYLLGQLLQQMNRFRLFKLEKNQIMRYRFVVSNSLIEQDRFSDFLFFSIAVLRIYFRDVLNSSEPTYNIVFEHTFFGNYQQSILYCLQLKFFSNREIILTLLLHTNA